MKPNRLKIKRLQPQGKVFLLGVVVLLGVFFSLNLVYALGVNIPTPESKGNFSGTNVNNSIYWQGHTGTDGSWLTGITYNYNQTTPAQLYCDNNLSKFLNLSGTNANQNININNYNFSTNGTGFFTNLGSILNRITKLWINTIDFSGSINSMFWNTSVEGTTPFWNIYYGNPDGTQVKLNDIGFDSNLNQTNYNVTADKFIGDGSLLTGIVKNNSADIVLYNTTLSGFPQFASIGEAPCSSIKCLGWCVNGSGVNSHTYYNATGC